MKLEDRYRMETGKEPMKVNIGYRGEDQAVLTFYPTQDYMDWLQKREEDWEQLVKKSTGTY